MRAGMCAPWRAVLVSVAVAAWCGVAAGAEVTELRVEEKQAILDAHNKHRRLAAKGGQGPGHPSAGGIGLMYWDAGLEEMAKKRAAHCYFGHFGGPQMIVDDYKAVLDKVSYGRAAPMTAGENIALFRDSESFLQSEDRTPYLVNSVSAWVGEGQLFDWEQKACYADTCGHWAQVVAESTRYVGCAAAACPSGIVGGGSQYNTGVVVHCNYWPPKKSGYPYLKSYNDFYAAYCIRCRAWDYKHCDDHLCSGGINPLWFSSGYTNDTIAQCDDGLGRTVTPCFPYGKPPITAAPQTAETPAPTSVPATPVPTPAPTSAPITVPATPVPTSAPTTVPATPVPATPVPTSVPTSAPTTVPATPAPASGKWHTTCPEATQVAAFQSVDAFDQHAPLLFGGNFRVAARVLINRHTSWARVFDFGNGPRRDNVLIAQTSGSGRLSLHVFVNSRSQSITCNTQAPVGRSFDVEASVFNGEAVLYVDGVLCAQGQVMAPRAVVRGGNLIGRSHWAHDSLLDGEVSSFVLETCAA